jgi:transposase
VTRQRDATLRELCARVQQAGGVASNPSMMCRELQRLDLPRKKSRSTIANGTRSGSKH